MPISAQLVADITEGGGSADLYHIHLLGGDLSNTTQRWTLATCRQSCSEDYAPALFQRHDRQCSLIGLQLYDQGDRVLCYTMGSAGEADIQVLGEAGNRLPQAL